MLIVDEYRTMSIAWQYYEELEKNFRIVSDSTLEVAHLAFLNRNLLKFLNDI